MMEHAIFDVKDKINSLQFVINAESTKVLELEELLKGIKTSVEVTCLSDVNREREMEIEQARRKLGLIAAECEALLEDIADRERNKCDLNPPDVQEMRNELKLTEMEIGKAEDQLYELEGMVEKVKESNAWLEKDMVKKLDLLESDFDKIEKVGRLKLNAEEKEAADNLEVLRDNLKKAKQQLITLEMDVKAMQAQCNDEQKKNEYIEDEIRDLRDMYGSQNYDKKRPA